MTTAAITNYGVTLKKTDSTGGVSIGEVVNVDPPDYMVPAVEATNHGSSGVREFVSSKLAEMAEFKATINYVDSNIATLVTALAAGTVAAYEIGFPTGQKQTFSALVTGIKPLAADAQNPEALKADITFRPTGTLGMSS